MSHGHVSGSGPGASFRGVLPWPEQPREAHPTDPAHRLTQLIWTSLRAFQEEDAPDPPDLSQLLYDTHLGPAPAPGDESVNQSNARHQHVHQGHGPALTTATSNGSNLARSAAVHAAASPMQGTMYSNQLPAVQATASHAPYMAFSQPAPLPTQAPTPPLAQPPPDPHRATAAAIAGTATAAALAGTATTAAIAGQLLHRQQFYSTIYELLSHYVRHGDKPVTRWPPRGPEEEGPQVVFAAPRIQNGGMGRVTTACGGTVRPGYDTRQAAASSAPAAPPESVPAGSVQPARPPLDPVPPAHRLIIESRGTLHGNAVWPDGTAVSRYYLAAPGELSEAEAARLLPKPEIVEMKGSGQRMWHYKGAVLLVVAGHQVTRTAPTAAAAVAAGGVPVLDGDGGSAVAALPGSNKRPAPAAAAAAPVDRGPPPPSSLFRRSRQWTLALSQNCVYLFLEAVVMGNTVVMRALLPRLPQREGPAAPATGAVTEAPRGSPSSGRGRGRAGAAAAAVCGGGGGSAVNWDRVHTPRERRTALHLAVQLHRVWPPPADTSNVPSGYYDVPYMPIAVRRRIVRWLLRHSELPSPSTSPVVAAAEAAQSTATAMATAISSTAAPRRSMLVMQRNTNMSVPLLTLMRYADCDGQCWRPLVADIMHYMSYDDYCDAESKTGWYPHHMASSIGSRPPPRNPDPEADSHLDLNLDSADSRPLPPPGSRACLEELLQQLLRAAEEKLRAVAAAEAAARGGATKRRRRSCPGGSLVSIGQQPPQPPQPLQPQQPRQRQRQQLQARAMSRSRTPLQPQPHPQLQPQPQPQPQPEDLPLRRQPVRQHRQQPTPLLLPSQPPSLQAWSLLPPSVALPAPSVPPPPDVAPLAAVAAPAAAAPSAAARALVSNLLFHLRSSKYDGRLLQEVAAAQGVTVEPANEKAPSFACALESLSNDLQALLGIPEAYDVRPHDSCDRTVGPMMAAMLATNDGETASYESTPQEPSSASSDDDAGEPWWEEGAGPLPYGRTDHWPSYGRTAGDSPYPYCGPGTSGTESAGGGMGTGTGATVLQAPVALASANGAAEVAVRQGGRSVTSSAAANHGPSSTLGHGTGRSWGAAAAAAAGGGAAASGAAAAGARSLVADPIAEPPATQPAGGAIRAEPAVSGLESGAGAGSSGLRASRGGHGGGRSGGGGRRGHGRGGGGRGRRGGLNG